MDDKEQMGGSAGEVIKIGNKVHRSLPTNAEFIHELLIYLKSKNAKFAPEFFGIDKADRQILTFIEGDVPTSEYQRGADGWQMPTIGKVFKLIRQLHDLCAESELRGERETVIHGDLTPRNTVYKDGIPFAFIDWDLARPGDRIEDLAFAIWKFLCLGAPGHDDPKRKQRA